MIDQWNLPDDSFIQLLTISSGSDAQISDTELASNKNSNILNRESQ
jgi:hypothetical protein